MNNSITRKDEYDEEISNYVDNHRDFLTRVLRRGDTEARGYALAVLANGGTEDDIESVLQELEKSNNSGE